MLKMRFSYAFACYLFPVSISIALVYLPKTIGILPSSVNSVFAHLISKGSHPQWVGLGEGVVMEVSGAHRGLEELGQFDYGVDSAIAVSHHLI